MSYLGAIGTTAVLRCPTILDVWTATHAAHEGTQTRNRRVLVINAWWVPGFSLMGAGNFPADGYISGTVQEEGIPVGGSLVQLFHKRTGICVGKAYSATDGSFQFDNIPSADAASYFAVAHDVPGGTNYKAVIIDQLTAVT